jgi:maltoporin
MRWQYLAFVLVIGTGHAWAQPEAQPAEPQPDPPTVTPTAPADQPPPPAATPTPEKAPPVAVEPMPQPKPEVVVVPKRAGEGFRFGSYGRAIAGSDLRGGKPEKVNIVAHGPRIVEDSYLELEFSYGFVRPRGGDDYLVMRPIITLAFDGTLFHDTGEFDAHPALRNMYLDARIAKHVSAWAGSRMYRGDDIYLFDYWPLDDQNMIGAGVALSQPIGEVNGEPVKQAVDLAAAVGFNRLNHPFQFQEISVANPVQGATTVEQLNRQRAVASVTASYVTFPEGDGIGAKAKVHAEVHQLPSGTRKRDDGTLEALPADSGFLIGGEVGVFGMAPRDSGYRRHLNLFARYAKGLAAFDELAPPTSFGRELETSHASELSFGVSGNYDFEFGQLMLGALSRRFIDADTTSVDADDGWEYAIAARPLARIVRDFYVGGDISYQARFPRGLNEITLRAEDPAEFQIAPMIVFSPMGPSAYDRPQLRLVYRAAHLNDGARDLYVPDDPRHDHEWVWFLGLQAEWWFNSSTYR